MQMLLVAFSRRMCCSRVCKVSTKVRRPRRSTVSPTMRPGHTADELFTAGEDAEKGTAVTHRRSERLSLSDSDIDAVVSRSSQETERDRIEDLDR